MGYEVLSARKIEKYLARISQKDHARIQDTIDKLSDEPRPDACSKLRNIEGYKIRVGDHRILYTIDDEAKVVRVYKVGHRRDIYR